MPIKTTNISDVSVNIDKSSFNKLAVNLNMNILINISAYINVLKKIVEFELDNAKKQQFQELIETLTQQQTLFGTTFEQIQTELNIENPQTVGDIISNNSTFLDGILGAQTAATLGTMVAVAALALGGAKNKTNIIRKTKYHKVKGKTKTQRIKKHSN
jgi:hypothetical protein